MKNTMKKLMSLVLVAIMLISAVPFQAAAAEGFAVDVTVKDSNNTVLAQEVRTQQAGDQYTMQAYLDSVYPAWSAGYTVEKFWIKNAETGDDGRTVDGNHTVVRDSRVVIKLKAKPAATYTVTVEYNNGVISAKDYTVTDGQPIGENVLPSAPAKTGYIFKGWKMGEYIITSGSIVNASYNGRTITAQWERVGCIECGQTSGHTDECSLNPNQPTTPTVTEPTVTEPTPTQPTPTLPDDYEPGDEDYGDEDYGDEDYEETDFFTVKFFDVNKSCIRTVEVAAGEYISTDDLTLAALEAGSKKNYTFAGWSYNGTNTVFTNDQLSLVPITGNTNLYAKFTANQNASKLNNYQVYLNIYKDTLVGSPDRQVNITTGLALDGKVTLAEVKALVMNYYTAKNSYGIGFDGLYLAEGDWVYNYVVDTKYNTLENVNEMKQSRNVYIHVMITNATAKTAYTADASNPKTGDSIYAPMMIMGVSAAALATVLYVYNKKRQAV